MSEPVRVFVSHSHEDNDFGVRLVQDLRAALGGDGDAVWYDASGGLKGGDEWWGKIVTEITARPIFVLVLSPAAMASRYVLSEFTIAFKLWHERTGRRIVPVLFQPCAPRADMTLFQMIWFVAPKPYEQSFTELLTALGDASSGGVPTSQQQIPVGTTNVPTPPSVEAQPNTDYHSDLLRTARQRWDNVLDRVARDGGSYWLRSTLPIGVEEGSPPTIVVRVADKTTFKLLEEHPSDVLALERALRKVLGTYLLVRLVLPS